MTISGFTKRSESIPTLHLSNGAHRISGNLPQGPIVWGPDYAHDVEQLILVIPSPEERNARDHLGEDTTT